MEQKQMYEDLMNKFENFKANNDQLENEVKTLGEATQETKSIVEKLQDAMDDVQTKMKRPAVAEEQKEVESKHFTAYKKFLKSGDDRELKSLNETIDPQGGYTVPADRENTIIRKVIETSPVRQVSNVINVNSNRIEIPAEGSTDFEAKWTDELTAFTETKAATVRLETIQVNDLFAQPHVTEDLLMDSAINIEQWLNERVSRQFAKKEGKAFLVGDAVTKPEGITVSPKVTNGVTAAAVADFTADELIEMYYSIFTEYSNNGTWMMNRTSLRKARQLKDGLGNYIWQPGLQGQQPGVILGRPVLEAPDLPDPATGNNPIIFGDFSRGYTIAQRMGIRVKRDEVTKAPFIKFNFIARVGGQVTLGEALSKMTMA